MRSSPLIRTLLLVGLVAALPRCGGASLSGADEKKGEKKEDENAKGDKPQEVSGAFLNDCEYVASATLADGDTAPIGCTVLDKNGRALDGDKFSFAMKLHGDDDKESAMTASERPDGDRYHVTAELPATHKTSGYLAMNVTDQKGRSKTLKTATKDIRAAGSAKPSLGGEAEGAAKPNPPAVTPAPAPGPAPDGIAPFTFKASARIPSGVGFTIDNMRPDLMCDAGNVKTLPLLETDPKAITHTGDFCFKKFQPWKLLGTLPLPDGGKRRAHEGAGCRFALIDIDGKDIYYIATGAEPSLADLEKYAASKPCP